MTLIERLNDVKKRLSYAYEIKTLKPEDWHAVLVSIIRDCQRDGIEAERETCAKTAEMCGQVLSGVGHDYEAIAAKAIADKIRARSNK